MPKTAAQLVPLKTQLQNSMSLFRFSDASDFASGLAYVELPYDNSGALFPGQVSPAVGGAALPTVLTPPTNFALTAANAPNTGAAGVNRYHAGSQIYVIQFYDASDRQSQAYVYQAEIPVDVYNASITFNITYPPGAAGCFIWKYLNASGCFYWKVPNTTSSVTDTTAIYNGMGTSNGIAQQGYAYPSPNAASTAPVAGPDNVTVIVNNSGGSFRASAYAYNLTAHNSLGETTGVAQRQQQVTGAPLIQGAASGRMANIAVADNSGVAGTLEPGIWRYQVTAYSESPNERYGSINGIPFQKGAGHNESLPSAEVQISRTAAGTNVITWVAVQNAAGYVIYRSRDLPSPVASAPTTATTGGTIAASTTYDYIVTATNANGETIGSNVVTGTTGATTATNTITVSWAAVRHAYGYKIYRGTGATPTFQLVGTITLGSTTSFTDTGAAPTAVAPPGTNTATGAGQAVFLVQQAGNGVTSYTDNGATNPSVNSGFRPPKVYNGTFGAVQVTGTWTASADATGYYMYRAAAGAAGNGQGGSAKNVLGQAATTALDDLSGFAGRTIPNANYGGTSVLFTVGRIATMYNFETVMQKIGASFAGVIGKSYRFGIYNNSNNTTVWNGPFFTVTNATETYYEQYPNAVLAPNNQYYFFVQGVDTASPITWRSNMPPPLSDNPSALAAEAGTYIASQAQYPITNTQINGLGNGPSKTRVEAGSTFPMKMIFRRTESGATILGAAGTFLGDGRFVRYAFSPNKAYASPIRAIVPTWSIATPKSPVDQIELARRWAEVAVSTDGGATFTSLTNQQRFVFPAPATQLQFRYTLPESSAKMSFDRRIMTGVPADNTNWGTNFGMTSDTGHYVYYYENASVNMQTYSNGHLLLGQSNNTWIYTNLSFIDVGRDVDITMTGYFNQVGNFGIKFRHQGKAYQGYYFYLDSNGTCGLVRQTNDSTATVGLATVSAAVTVPVQNSSNQYTLRVIAVGTHIMCFINGRLVIDTTDATYSDASYKHHGLAGQRAVTTGYSLTSLSDPARTAPWELEYVTAYLETT